uniref:Flagellar associated protein n=1 Tax=Tetradesmus obliquus TaxID=3088 RepID=A0A383WC15_TETOB|eukprot:jgi/Sobl393_1/11/SZX74750.1
MEFSKRREDPSVKGLRSGFGHQVRSNSPSNPSIGFGSSVRDASLHQYLSPEHAKAMSGNNSQGPVYKVYSSMGQQPESTAAYPGTMTFGTAQRLPKPGKSGVPGPGHYKTSPALGEQKESKRSTSPRAVFGTATRAGQEKVYLDGELMKTYYGKESAPPGSYNVPGALGRQVASTKESAPGIKIGTSLRALDYTVMRSKDMPGAGQYNTYRAVGKQPLSSKKTLPAHSFGKSTRDASKKTFISKQHEKQAYGIGSPGPGTAKPYTSSGSQQLSTKHTNPTWGFGTSKRLKDYNNDAPGPGTYYA